MPEILTQADLHPTFPNQIGPLTLLCKLLTMTAFLWTQMELDHTNLTSSSSQIGIRVTGSVWSHVSASLPGQEGEGPLQATLNVPNRFSSWEGWELPLALAINSSPYLCITWEPSMPRTGFGLRAIGSACPPLSSSAADYTVSRCPCQQLWSGVAGGHSP